LQKSKRRLFSLRFPYGRSLFVAKNKSSMSIKKDWPRRLRILQIVDGFRMGGAENKLWELIERLDAQKYEILLANVGPTGPLQSQFEKLGIEMFHFPRRFSFDPLPLLQLRRLIRGRQIDIIQTTLLWADIIGGLAAWWAGAPAIISWETVTHNGDPYHGNLQRRLGYEWAMKHCDLIVAVSHEVGDSVRQQRRIPPEKIRVIHYGVDLQKFFPRGQEAVLAKRWELGATSADLLIAIVARLEPLKGHRYFIEAFAPLVKQFPQVHAIFVGDGSLRHELEQQVQQLGLGNHLKFLGVRKDVPDILCAVDLLVLPALGGEGLPNVLLEGMACAKPVIATRVGGVPELVREGENGYLVPPEDVPALQKALAHVVADRQRLRRMAAAARRIVENEFSLRLQVSRFEEVFDRLAAEKVFQFRNGHAAMASHKPQPA
jgi:glycosyltransferase involved in cell wall biosynthesis